MSMFGPSTIPACFMVAMARLRAAVLVSLPVLLQGFVVPAPFAAPSRRTAARVTAHTLDGNEIPGALEPLHNVILVKVKDAADVSAGGIVLPDQAKEKPTEGEVVAAGPGRRHPETAVLMPMCVKPGDSVLYGKYDGMAVQYDETQHVLIRDDDVLLTWNGPKMTVDAVETVRDRILVKVKKQQEKTAGGILLAPSMGKQRPTEGVVMKVGPGRTASTGDRADIMIKVGDNVKFRDYAGTEVKIDDDNYLAVLLVTRPRGVSPTSFSRSIADPHICTAFVTAWGGIASAPTQITALQSMVSSTQVIPSQPDPELEADARVYEYIKACDPDMSDIPVLAHPPALHESGPTRVIPFDLGDKLGVEYAATSPNLLASYVRIIRGESLDTEARATSQAFFVIRGQGVSTSTEHGTIHWSKGDLFVLPATAQATTHRCTDDEEDAALYWVSDEPLMKYLGVTPSERKFAPTLFTHERLFGTVELLRHEPGVEHKNRLGVLLGNKTTDNNTKTLTHVLWSLLNLLPAGRKQRPHKHNSVALDLCVRGPATGAYTLMGPELGEDGWVKDPIRMDWATGGVFVTPPGWWHSHHNDSSEDAWVLPLQDAGLHTHMRTLDIQFSGGAAVLPDDKAAPMSP